MVQIAGVRRSVYLIVNTVRRGFRLIPRLEGGDSGRSHDVVCTGLNVSIRLSFNLVCCRPGRTSALRPIQLKNEPAGVTGQIHAVMARVEIVHGGLPACPAALVRVAALLLIWLRLESSRSRPFADTAHHF